MNRLLLALALALVAAPPALAFDSQNSLQLRLNELEDQQYALQRQMQWQAEEMQQQQRWQAERTQESQQQAFDRQLYGLSSEPDLYAWPQ